MSDQPITIYSFGYQGQRPQYLAQLAERLDATVVDVRYRPLSSQPGWKRSELAKLLSMRYLHVQAFGNINLDNGETWELRDPDLGCETVLPILAKHSIILLCRETVAAQCHRSLVADILAYRTGLQIIDLLPEAIQKHIDAGQMQLL